MPSVDQRTDSSIQLADGTAPPSLTLASLTKDNGESRANLSDKTLAGIAATNFVGELSLSSPLRQAL